VSSYFSDFFDNSFTFFETSQTFFVSNPSINIQASFSVFCISDAIGLLKSLLAIESFKRFFVLSSKKSYLSKTFEIINSNFFFASSTLELSIQDVTMSKLTAFNHSFSSFVSTYSSYKNFSRVYSRSVVLSISDLSPSSSSLVILKIFQFISTQYLSLKLSANLVRTSGVSLMLGVFTNQSIDCIDSISLGVILGS
jgi:hypothetical protein